MLVQPDSRQLSLRRQCELLSLSRASLYYEAVEVSAEEVALMRRIDEVFTRCPFWGSRNIAFELKVNRKAVQRLMRVMGLQALAPGPHTSKPHPEHQIYPYLLRGMKIDAVDQVWAADITYIPLAHGWAYMVAIIDWHSRAI